MPIRTNRGRAAVYRRFWGWPLRSPRHLAGTLVVLAVIIIAVGIALPRLVGSGGGGTGEAAGVAQGGETSQRQSGNAAQRGSGTGATSPLPTRLTAPLESPTPAEPDPVALEIAGKWAAAWVEHPDGITNEQWLEGLRPYTTKEYLPVMSTVDPANIPSTKVTGEPSAASSFSKSVKAIVPTDGVRLLLTVVRTDEGWRVAHYEQAEQ